MKDTHFYLGRIFDPASAQVTKQPLYYNPTDLTTHAVVTGMTGSGKTGLCISLMEEAALQGIPAILIDPKGDLTNLLLHFPELAPADFSPWLDADTVRRQGKSLEQAASETAERWRSGLAEWDITPERIRALANAAQYSVYTPGSDAGKQVSVLSSLEAPDLPWEGNKEILREKISSTVTALLGLVGLNDVDPLRSREHILLSNIFEDAWSNNKPLDMTELVIKVQNPPFDKLGAFPIENFFAAKERTDLAMTLNNILASPGFQSWREGQPLYIPDFLFSPDGRPRQTVFYTAHLSEGERMFFTTLLISAFEAWMRTQSGSTSLRAILYFDEIFGYLPPQSNPPSKTPLLRMLKQARAFGVGLVLATQNPVDVDYKALSNAGSWFVGKLQTERDKQRLLDGLQGASADLDRNAYDKIISGLGKRTFLLHNIHTGQPVLFQTRWAMNFLAGPLTRAQIPALNRLHPAADSTQPASRQNAPSNSQPDLSKLQPISFSAAELEPDFEPMPAVAAAPAPAAKTANGLPGTQTRPHAPNGIAEFFLPVNYSITEAWRAANTNPSPDGRIEAILYRPTLLAAARVRFFDRRYGVDSEIPRIVLVEALDPRGVVRWESSPYQGPGLDKLERDASPQARYESLPAPLSDARLLTNLQRDFTDWVYRSTSVNARANQALKVYAGPDVSAADFRKACADTARDNRDREIAKMAATIDRQLNTLQDRLRREERELTQDQVEYEQRKWEERGNLAEIGASVFGIGRKKSLTTQLTKNRMTQQSKADVEQSAQAIQQFEQQIAELQARRAQMVEESNERWASIVNQVSEIPLTPKKSDIFVEYFGIAWKPCYLVSGSGQVQEIPAFGPE
ncbi:MAG: hypothetical protein CVU44_19405 [Chloroflexi bacterium HGW-Chloroflexi-6]|nr:MAG: hypothetical protein CVU44_19405 [Chloroflexi bacterium HGW-Chloroflexi-6]